VIPLKDTVPRRGFAGVTLALLAANVAVFLHEAALGPWLQEAVWHYGLVPARLVHWTELGGAPLDPARFTPLLTSMFWHGGFLHLAGNMLYLWIFGAAVEDRLGHTRYLLFYLIAGSIAGLAQVALMPDSTLPTVGASGAIAGVLGAYLVSFPRARVVAFVPIFILPWIVEIPAVVYLIFWFALQLLSGLSELHQASAGGGAGVAWWAHAGGFIAGAVLVKLMAPARRVRRLAQPWRA
jgi:membrane associated rhomboid family serine protease